MGLSLSRPCVYLFKTYSIRNENFKTEDGQH